MTDGESLGQFLVRLRGKERQEDAAKRIGIDRSSLIGLEKDRLGLGAKRAAKIAAGYNLPRDGLNRYITQRGNGGLEDRVRRIVDERFSELRAELETEQSELREAVAQLEAALTRRRRRSR